ncbi:MAG: SDR family NAD(P)-dependent oxidoreductase [Alphaproteobacteria bacterium]
MIKNFEGKTAVVTGGASGIGHATVQKALDRGMNVVIGDIEEGALNGALAHFRAQQGAKVEGVLCDVADRQSILELKDKAVDAFGNIHFMFNNAGVGGGGSIAECTNEGWDWTLDVNLNGVFWGTQAFLEHMRGHGEESHIVSTASMAGMFAGGNLGVYSVTKFGVVAMMESLAAELEAEGSNVGASVLCPGFVATNIARSGRNRQDKYGESAEVDESQLEAAEAFIKAGLDPIHVGELVMQAIEANRLYIFTAPEMQQILQMRFDRIMNDYGVVDGLLKEMSANEQAGIPLDQDPTDGLRGVKG